MLKSALCIVLGKPVKLVCFPANKTVYKHLHTHFVLIEKKSTYFYANVEAVDALVAPFSSMWTLLIFVLFLGIAWLTWKRYALKMNEKHHILYLKLITSSFTSKRRVLALVVVAVARRKKLQLTMDAFTLTAASGVKLKLSKVRCGIYYTAICLKTRSKKLT